MKVLLAGLAPSSRFLAAIKSCSYLDWYCRLSDSWLQVCFTAPDSKTGEMTEQRGRKWRLSPHMTRGEIVQTLFLAISVAEEHERRENFQYRGERIFGPHHDLDELASFTSNFAEDLRT